MRLVARWSLRILLLFVALRAVAFCIHVYFDASKTVENYHYESTFVHFAWRVQVGLDLYPNWQELPHTNNFFAPLYFWTVGYLGRWIGVSMPELFHLSRVITIVCALGTTLVVAGEGARRWGLAAGVIGGLATIGPGPMVYFAVMARPDTMAEFFGVAGFMMATRSAIRSTLFGCVLLALAALTKQNYGIFLIAAVATLLIARRFKTAIAVVGCSGAILFLIIVLATLCGESRLLASFFDEGSFPFAFAIWRRIFVRLISLSPDTVVFAVLAIVLWSRPNQRDIGLVTLATILLGLDVLSVAKTGSDLNYFLNLRCLGGLFVASLWHVGHGLDPLPKLGRQNPNEPAEAKQSQLTSSLGWITAAAVVAILSVFPSLIFDAAVAENAWTRTRSFQSPHGKQFLAEFALIHRIAQDSNVKLFSDADYVAYYQGERAAFLDAFDFRFLVETGRIQPDMLQHRFDSEYYDLILLSSDLNAPGYSQYFKKLPASIAESIRQHYKPTGMAASLFAYEPRSRPRR